MRLVTHKQVGSSSHFYQLLAQTHFSIDQERLAHQPQIGSQSIGTACPADVSIVADPMTASLQQLCSHRLLAASL